MWATGQSGGAPDRSCSLSGASSDACSDSVRAVGTVHYSRCRRPLAQVAVAPLGTPDSPVNYSGVVPRIPEGGKFGVDLPSAPDTVRWCTGHCSVRETRVAFGYLLLFLFEPLLGLFIGLC
jgi:hypothetical protein